MQGLGAAVISPGFVVTSFDGNGNSGHLFGHFTKYLAEGPQGVSSTPSFGTYTIRLVD